MGNKEREKRLCALFALAAASLGVGNVICGMTGIPFGGPKGDTFRQKAGFHDGWEFGMAVLVGFSKAEGAAHKPDTTKIRFVE